MSLKTLVDKRIAPVRDAASCQQWLDSLGDPGDPDRLPAIERLFEGLTNSRKSPELAFAVAEQARPAHLEQLDARIALLRGQRFPMPASQRRLAMQLIQGFTLGRELFARLHTQLMEDSGEATRTVIPGTAHSLRAILPLIRALDYQSRLLLTLQANHLSVDPREWDRLCVYAAHVRASTFQDVPLPDLRPQMPSATARAIFILPLLMALIRPAERTDAEFGLALRLAKRWAARVGFRLEGGNDTVPNPNGPVLGLTVQHAVRMESHKLMRSLEARQDEITHPDPGMAARLPRGMTLAGTRSFLELLSTCWAPGHVLLIAPDTSMGRVRICFGFPGPTPEGHLLAHWAQQAEGAEWIGLEQGRTHFQRESALPVALGDLVTLVRPEVNSPAVPMPSGVAAARTDPLLMGRVISLAQTLNPDPSLPPRQRIGVRVWAGAPSLVSVRGGADHFFHDAVRLAADPATGESESLLLPTARYAGEQSLVLRDAAGEKRVTLGGALETGAAFERVRLGDPA